LTPFKTSTISIIGGGIIGLATAWKILQCGLSNQVLVLEKESMVGQHQSGNNSGVLHAGLYYKPGSLKAKLATSGIKQMTQFCVDYQIPHEICGKVVVATDDAETQILRKLHQTGEENGLQGLRWLNLQQLNEIEPHVSGVAALHVPEEGIVSYKAVCTQLKRLIHDAGGSVITAFDVADVKQNGDMWTITSTDNRAVHAHYLINCAGLYADKIAARCGVKSDIKIVPFRGQYYKLRKESENLVRHLIYPVPNPDYPFLGVHFTRMIDGGVEAGPNAVLAFAREGYTFWRINLAEFWDSLTFIGLRKFINKHKGMVLDELDSGLRKEVFLKRLQKLIPSVQSKDLSVGGAGVRAQAMGPDGSLIQDFVIEQHPKSLHIISAPSPGATASLAIADYLISEYIITQPFSA
jgi:L-2-hydroxyglutarate oxidase